jgi:hypothetical protein
VGLNGTAVPPNAPAIFEEAAESNGVGEGGAAPVPGNPQQPSTAPSDDDPGTLATVARVVLGVAALGGVPAALAISRRPPRVMREGFA